MPIACKSQQVEPSGQGESTLSSAAFNGLGIEGLSQTEKEKGGSVSEGKEVRGAVLGVCSDKQLCAQCWERGWRAGKGPKGSRGMWTDPQVGGRQGQGALGTELQC